jgi:general secretion pathway protein G
MLMEGRNVQIIESKRLPTLVPSARGFSLIELIVATTILLILSGTAIPIARVAIKRENEHQLRQALWAMRDGIDRY